MSEKNEQRRLTAVARVGDAEYLAPDRLTYFTVGEGDEAGDVVDYWYDLTAEVVVVDGRARYDKVLIDFHRPASPLDMQRLPWGRFLDAALAQHAVRVDRRSGAVDEPAGLDAIDAIDHKRRRDARSSRSRTQADHAEPRRFRVDDERLRRVLDLRDEARAAGAPRVDEYIGERLHLSSAYVRQLISKATKRLTTEGD